MSPPHTFSHIIHTFQWLTGSYGYTIFQILKRPLFLAGRLKWFLVYVEHLLKLLRFRFFPDLFRRCLITVSLHGTVWFHTRTQNSSHWNVSPHVFYWGFVNLTSLVLQEKIHRKCTASCRGSRWIWFCSSTWQWKEWAGLPDPRNLKTVKHVSETMTAFITI